MRVPHLWDLMVVRSKMELDTGKVIIARRFFVGYTDGVSESQ